MLSKTALLALLAVAEARFGQEQGNGAIAALQALGNFGNPGQAATFAGQSIQFLLAAANPCAKLTQADAIVAGLGTDPQVISAVRGYVAAEQNFNPFVASIPSICDDASLPATAELRGVIPLVDPAVTGADAENANSATSVTTPFAADGQSVADVMIAQGFSNFNKVAADGTKSAAGGAGDAAAGGAAVGGAAAEGAAAEGSAAGGAAAAGNVAAANGTADAAGAAGDAANANAGAQAAAGAGNAGAGMGNAGSEKAAGGKAAGGKAKGKAGKAGGKAGGKKNKAGNAANAGAAGAAAGAAAPPAAAAAADVAQCGGTTFVTVTMAASDIAAASSTAAAAVDTNVAAATTTAAATEASAATGAASADNDAGNANEGNAANGNADAGNANAGNANAGNAAAGNAAAAGSGAINDPVIGTFPGFQASSIAGLDFGSCTPTLKFEAGLNGRKETESTFQAQDPQVNKGQQEALNPLIIARRILDQMTNVCGANQAAKDAITAATTQISGLARDATVATTWNTLLGFDGVDINPDQAPKAGLVGHA